MLNPIARTEKLTIRQLPDETLVYDHQTGKGHCLNPIAALVWKQCDGTATVAELAGRIGQPAAVVESALEQLSRRDLLVQPAPPLNPGGATGTAHGAEEPGCRRRPAADSHRDGDSGSRLREACVLAQGVVRMRLLL